jgi:hypothetical protein
MLVRDYTQPALRCRPCGPCAAARFDGVLLFRQQHKMAFGVSDLYFLCRLTPVSSAITACAVEIAEAAWRPVDTVLTTAPLLLKLGLRLATKRPMFSSEEFEEATGGTGLCANQRSPPEVLDSLGSNHITSAGMVSFLDKSRKYTIFFPAGGLPR